MRVVLTDEWTKRHSAASVPGAYFERNGVNAYVVDDPTPRAAAVILRLFPGLADEYPNLVALRDSLAQDSRPVDYATNFNRPIEQTGAATHVQATLMSEGHDWYDYQALDLGYVQKVLEQHGGAYIGWERGLGKTLAACTLIEAAAALRVLVVCPNTAKDPVWRAELERFLPYATVLVLPNEKRKRERMLAEMQRRRDWRDGHRPVILVAHYEALAIIDGPNKTGLKKLGEWDLVVADEAHRIKNPKAKMTRALKRVPARMKLALSGSVIQNHPEELFSPLQWLFPENYRSQWRDWNDRYLDYVDNGYSRVCVGIKPERLEDLRRELGVFMVYRRKKDELDLPDKTDQTLLVELGPRQRRAYDQLRDEAVARLDDGTVVAATDGLALLTRLRQVATGLDVVGETVTDSRKLDVAEDLILDNEDEAFVCFSWFRASAASLAQRLEARGIGTFLVTGDTPHKQRTEYIRRFQAGEGRVFIGTISTLGESVNLYRANNAIFIDRSWNPAANDQAADRIYRIGQDKPVTITHLVARDTVDELRVLPVLNDKEQMRRLILGS